MVIEGDVVVLRVKGRGRYVFNPGAPRTDGRDSGRVYFYPHRSRTVTWEHYAKDEDEALAWAKAHEMRHRNDA